MSKWRLLFSFPCLQVSQSTPWKTPRYFISKCVFGKLPGIWIFSPSGFRPGMRPWIWDEWVGRCLRGLGIEQNSTCDCVCSSASAWDFTQKVNTRTSGPESRELLVCLTLVETRLSFHNESLFSGGASRTARSLWLLFGEIYFLYL